MSKYFQSEVDFAPVSPSARVVEPAAFLDLSKHCFMSERAVAPILHSMLVCMKFSRSDLVIVKSMVHSYLSVCFMICGIAPTAGTPRTFRLCKR